MLMDLRPQCPCNRQMFPGIQDKLSLFQGCHLVHIDDAVPVAAYELGIAEQQAGKIVKTHVSPHKPVLQMDLDVMVAVIRIEDVEFEGQRLLLCEDNMLNMEIAKTLLEDKGFIVDCAEDGVEGLHKYKEAGPDAYAGILMDIRMPRMNGYEAVECIRALDREDAKKVPIIAMTADAYPEDIQHCHDAGMNAHIAKPIDPESMFRVLAKWCAK